MSLTVKSLVESFGKKSLWEAIKGGGYRIILDGNLAYVPVCVMPQRSRVPAGWVTAPSWPVSSPRRSWDVRTRTSPRTLCV